MARDPGWSQWEVKVDTKLGLKILRRESRAGGERSGGVAASDTRERYCSHGPPPPPPPNLRPALRWRCCNANLICILWILIEVELIQISGCCKVQTRGAVIRDRCLVSLFSQYQENSGVIQSRTAYKELHSRRNLSRYQRYGKNKIKTIHSGILHHEILKLTPINITRYSIYINT